jgi:hypothetical protein
VDKFHDLGEQAFEKLLHSFIQLVACVSLSLDTPRGNVQSAMFQLLEH